jgi:hypothetical protein
LHDKSLDAADQTRIPDDQDPCLDNGSLFAPTRLSQAGRDLLHLSRHDLERLPSSEQLGRSIGKRDDPGLVGNPSIEHDRLAGCNTRGRADPVESPFAHQGSGVIAR